MTEIKVRLAEAADLPLLVEMDHSYHTDYVWQMDLNPGEGQVGVTFREVRLPRSMRVEYPRSAWSVAEDWPKRGTVFVAEYGDEVAGYANVFADKVVDGAWVADLLAMRRLRRHGIGTALVMAAQMWALEQGKARLILEMQSKNYPAISLANKLGYEFCGYNDQYYPNGDIAVYFGRRL